MMVLQDIYTIFGATYFSRIIGWGGGDFFKVFLPKNSYDYLQTFSLFIFSSTFSLGEYRLVVAQCLIEIKLKRLSK